MRRSLDSLFDEARQLLWPRHPPSLSDRVIRAGLTGTELELAEGRPAAPSAANRIPGGLIHDVLAGKHGTLHHRGLRLKGLYIDGSIDLSFLHWHGALALEACTISGDLVLDHCRPTTVITLDGSHARWISARNAAIDGTIFLRDGFRSDRGFYGLGMSVSGSLCMQNSIFHGPEDNVAQLAINLFRAHIGDLHLYGSRVYGGLYATGIKVDRNVRLQGGIFLSRREMGWEHKSAEYKGSVSLAFSEIEGSVYIWTTYFRRFYAGGGFTLRGASCGRLFIRKEIFDRYQFNVDGFEYSSLRSITTKEWLETIGQSNEFAPQAHSHLIQYCAKVGDLSTRRKTLLQLERNLTSQQSIWSPRRYTRWLHGALIGYGYNAWLAIVWLACVTAAAAWILHHGAVFAPKSAVGQPADPAEALSWSDSFRIVIDSFLPFAPLGMKDPWVAAPSDGGQWAWMAGFLALRFIAWGLAALALLSFTDVVRNPRA